jgi:hypothetical protein
VAAVAAIQARDIKSRKDRQKADTYLKQTGNRRGSQIQTEIPYF